MKLLPDMLATTSETFQNQKTRWSQQNGLRKRLSLLYECVRLKKETIELANLLSLQFPRPKWRFNDLIMSFSIVCTWSVRWIIEMAEMAGFLEENFVTIASLSFTFLECIGAVVLAFGVCHKLPSVEKWITAWLFYDAMTHFTLVRC